MIPNSSPYSIYFRMAVCGSRRPSQSSRKAGPRSEECRILSPNCMLYQTTLDYLVVQGSYNQDIAVVTPKLQPC